MSYESKLSVEGREDLLAVIGHRGINHVIGMIDEIVERIRNEMLSLPLPMEAERASLALYSKRCQADGAMYLATALKKKMYDLKKEGNPNDRS